MRRRLPLHLAAASMVVAGLTVAQNAYADFAAPPAPQAMREAGRAAERAARALARGDHDMAVIQAEHAVALVPDNAGSRMLLGRAYLAAGRLASAETAFADTLALDPAHPGAALKLALARLGTGDAEGARAVVAAHADHIPAADRGLALALAGDPGTGAALLEELVRTGRSTPQSRQNLALAYALAGRWAEARMAASLDLKPQLVARRLLAWSDLAAEARPAMRVAAVLRITPVPDAGMPERLALLPSSAPAPAPEPARQAEAAPPPPRRLDDGAAPLPAPAIAAAPASVPDAAAPRPAAPAALASAIRFAPPAEIVQPVAIRGSAIRTAVRVAAASGPSPIARLQRATYTPAASGRFAVQLGAYSSVARAETGWQAAIGRMPMLGTHSPAIATARHGAGLVYRLAVAGFESRADAAALCLKLRARGSQCFIRPVAGDMTPRWAAKPGVRLAAR
ncbi:tetratricopeptide repeat protein [Sphingomonas changnyeongensis]|uniref:Tetratricopeptide repeat protein n=1 Tax=Sphingomonas changnyeongensis TaxID=2698679 RepID=A0A7Z2S6F9_9SPHN|nr:SPOR domain-containing protein [Sphingomonas changnyeongensis]QHL91468.1 tetratricopeptide repeat protein [Sphingomonas changnyeongensis]